MEGLGPGRHRRRRPAWVTHHRPSNLFGLGGQCLRTQSTLSLFSSSFSSFSSSFFSSSTLLLPFLALQRYPLSTAQRARPSIHTTLHQRCFNARHQQPHEPPELHCIALYSLSAWPLTQSSRNRIHRRAWIHCAGAAAAAFQRHCNDLTTLTRNYYCSNYQLINDDGH